VRIKQGQTTLEYVYLIGIAAAAIIVMLVYVSRGFQGRLRVQADSLGEQYSPKNMRTRIRQSSYVDSIEQTVDKPKNIDYSESTVETDTYTSKWYNMATGEWESRPRSYEKVRSLSHEKF